MQKDMHPVMAVVKSLTVVFWLGLAISLASIAVGENDTGYILAWIGLILVASGLLISHYLHKVPRR